MLLIALVKCTNIKVRYNQVITKNDEIGIKITELSNGFTYLISVFPKSSQTD